jgi:hypothetical protein
MGTTKGRTWLKSKLKDDKDKVICRAFTINKRLWNKFIKMYKGNKSQFFSKCIADYMQANKN